MNVLPMQDNNDQHWAGTDSTIPSRDRDRAERMLSLPRTTRPAPNIPDYELLRLIGFGNYGEVWLARNALGSFRAVKVVYRESFDNFDRPFEREFQGLKQFEPISHARESQVDIFHVGRNDAAGFFYYVMELADAVKVQTPGSKNETETKAPKTGVDFEKGGSDPQAYVPRTLKHDIRTRGALPASECLRIGLSLVHALEHLHAHGLVHRDIKPSNIIFVNGVPKLADIGLVTSVDATRSFVGTDGYIAPEGPGTPQADLYSLGKVLYEMLTGKDRLDFPELPGDWRTRPESDQMLEFNEILTKACDDDLKRRYQTSADIRRDLELLQRGKSVKQERTREARWILARRAMPIAMLALVVSGGMLIVVHQLPQRSRSAAYSVHFGLPSTNDHANAIYEKALLLMRADDQSRMGEAYTNFINATRIDPRFVSPYVALLEMQIREHFSGMPTNGMARIRTLAAILNGLAPDLAATQVALSFGEWADMHYEQALNRCNRAIHLDPNYEFAHTHYAFMLLMMGRIQESNEEAREAKELASSKGIILLLPGHYHYYHRQYDQAIEQYREAQRLQSDFRFAHHWIGRALRAKGDYLGGLKEIQEYENLNGADETESRARFDNLRQAFNDGSTNGYWHKELEFTKKKPDTDFYWKAVVSIQLGDTNGALQWLNKSFDTREHSGGGWTHDFEDVIFDEYWDPYRGDSWFKEFVDKIGFERVTVPGKKLSYRPGLLSGFVPNPVGSRLEGIGQTH
jgi:serine/threonine protein kinase